MFTHSLTGYKSAAGFDSGMRVFWLDFDPHSEAEPVFFLVLVISNKEIFLVSFRKNIAYHNTTLLFHSGCICANS